MAAFRAGMLVAGALLIFSPGAQAAQRYAAVAGAGATCTQAVPCSLKTAVTKAKAGDEVIVNAGSYAVSEALAPEGSAVYIHGDLAGPMPQIVGSATPSIVTGLGSTLAHLDMSNTAASGWGAYCGAGATIERIRATASGMSGIGIYMPGDDCTVRDSVARATGPNSSAILGHVISGARTFTVRNVTAIASGPSSRGVVSDCLACLPPIDSSTIKLTNSIVDATATDLVGSGFSATLLVANSNFDTSKSILDEGGNQTAPPLFVDAAAGNYREAAGSPTIDAGVADPANGLVDFDGNPRTIGPATDIGAFEYLPPVPAVAAAASGRIQLLTMSPRRFRAANAGGAAISKRRKAPVGTRVAYSLSAGATVRFRVERRVVGRRVGKRCVKQTRANRKKRRCLRFARVKRSFAQQGRTGLNRFRFSGRIGRRALKPGRYRLVGRAGGATRRVGFRIVR